MLNDNLPQTHHRSSIFDVQKGRFVAPGSACGGSESKHPASIIRAGGGEEEATVSSPRIAQPTEMFVLACICYLQFVGLDRSGSVYHQRGGREATVSSPRIHHTPKKECVFACICDFQLFVVLDRSSSVYYQRGGREARVSSPRIHHNPKSSVYFLVFVISSLYM